MLAQGAVVTSFGLALATLSRRLGRAIAVSAASYAVVAFGWVIVVELGAVSSVLSWLGLFGPGDQEASQFFSLIAASGCPLAAQLAPIQSIDLTGALTRYAFYVGHVIVLLFTIGVALMFLGLTLATFNRAMGRMPERRLRAPGESGRSNQRTGRMHPRPLRDRLSWHGRAPEL